MAIVMTATTTENEKKTEGTKRSDVLLVVTKYYHDVDGSSSISKVPAQFIQRMFTLGADLDLQG